MQIYAQLAQRFAVVGHIEHACLILVLLGLEPVYGLGQEMVGVANRVVIDVDHVFSGAA